MVLKIQVGWLRDERNPGSDFIDRALRRAEMSEVPGNDLSALPHIHTHTHTIKTLTIKTVL